MLILGIDTSTSQVGCAIGGHEGVIASIHINKGRRHAETLTPAIAHACELADIELSDINLVAVDHGPGLFTGLRVGIATAQALGTSLGVPMIGLSSLDIVAFQSRLSSRLVCAVLDARRGEVYYALYRPVPGGVQLVAEPRVGSPDDVAAEIIARNTEVLIAGDGGHRYCELFSALSGVELADPGLSFPTASALVQLAHSLAMREEFVRPSAIEPVYLRAPDAQINWEANR